MSSKLGSSPFPFPPTTSRSNHLRPLQPVVSCCHRWLTPLHIFPYSDALCGSAVGPGDVEVILTLTLLN